MHPQVILALSAAFNNAINRTAVLVLKLRLGTSVFASRGLFPLGDKSC